MGGGEERGQYYTIKGEGESSVKSEGKCNLNKRGEGAVVVVKGK